MRDQGLFKLLGRFLPGGSMGTWSEPPGRPRFEVLVSRVVFKGNLAPYIYHKLFLVYSLSLRRT